MSKTARQAERVSAADELANAGPDGCGRCHTCAPNRLGGPIRMIVCPECGNKRCPHATDHRNACTGSNEPGQPGSAYPAVPTLDEVRVQCAPLVSAIKSEWLRTMWRICAQWCRISVARRLSLPVMTRTAGRADAPTAWRVRGAGDDERDHCIFRRAAAGADA